MDKGAIKTFAIEARKILMKSAATQAGFYGVTKDGCTDPIQKGAGFEVYRTIAGTENRIYGNDINRRRKLKEAVESQGFDQVIEETAYTWFNRLIAIRFMEVNGYLPTRTRVLSSETGSNTPDLVAQYMDVDLGMSDEEIEKVAGSIKDNRYDDAFALLFIKQCNALNELLPKLFEKTDDYMELLLKLSYTSDGVVRMLVDSIPESNFNVEEEGQVEIIGWLYQFYNTELNDLVYDGNMAKGRITKELLPAATTIYTPDWAIQYMVQNSVGRIWIEGHPDSALQETWEYYLAGTTQEADVVNKLSQINRRHELLTPEDIKIIDPCMGSGHILVYAFDILMQIYETEGYSLRDIPRLILKNNIFGLDIDKRAAQLAYFSILMKARQYDRRILMRKIDVSVLDIIESNKINRNQLSFFGYGMEPKEKKKAEQLLCDLLEQYHDAKEYGSILSIKEYDWELLNEYCQSIEEEGQLTLEKIGIEDTQSQLLQIIRLAQVMSKQYHVVITNPPYLGNSRFSPLLDKYVKEHYSLSKSDLSMVMYNHVLDEMVHEGGFAAFITTSSWMFLSSFEKFRLYHQKRATFDTIVDFGTELFDGKVGHNPIVAWVSRNSSMNYKATAIRLVEYCYSRRDEKQSEYFNERNRYYANKDDLSKIPGSPIAYWVGEKIFWAFNNCKPLGKIARARSGAKTGKNDKFIMCWWEVNSEDIDTNNTSFQQCIESGKKWFPHNKGGEFRNWYGNRELVVRFENGGEVIRDYAIKNKHAFDLNATDVYFKEGLTWTALTSYKNSFRYSPAGCIFDTNKGPMLFNDDHDTLMYILGFMVSPVAQFILKALNPSLSLQNGDVDKVPLVLSEEYMGEIVSLVEENIAISKKDYDENEYSFNFDGSYLVDGHSCEEAYENHLQHKNECYERLKWNSERLNSIFSDIYGVTNELTTEIPDKDISASCCILDRTEFSRRFLSFFVGCLFGRYTLTSKKIAYAGGKWRNEGYDVFLPDIDNCVPVMDDAYLQDDIVEQLCKFLCAVYGSNTLDKNLDFLATSLGNTNMAAKDVLRNYFINDFFADHCRRCTVGVSGKRPIYWLFDSGKQNGFKCLIYMHRYDKDTVGRVRSDYLRKAQDAIEGALKNAEYTIANSVSAVDKASATKKREKYIKQLNEIRTYFQALSHVALQRIEIDLDDGVKTNYAKFQGIEIIDENGKKQKIDLLAKI